MLAAPVNMADLLRHDTLRNLSVVYRILNTSTGAAYIGAATQVRKHSNAALQAAWLEHGASAFVFEVLEAAPDTALAEREAFHVRAERESGRTLYNAIDNFTVHAGWAQPDTARERIGDALRGRKRSDAHQAAINVARRGAPSPLRGVPLSAATRAKLSAAHIGKPPYERSPETRAKTAARTRAAWQRRLDAGWTPKPPEPCTQCGRLAHGRRRGLCHACNERKRRAEKRSIRTYDAYTTLGEIAKRGKR